VIAVVVVISDQSIRLFDVLRSLVTSLADTRIVIVADDQADIDTQFAGLGLAALYPDIRYLGVGNGGPGRARNRAIACVLDTMPDAEALCFLAAGATPADLSPPRLRRLLQHHPQIDWFDAADDYDGPAAPLIEALTDIRTTVSLVRRRVFDSELRFAEDLPDPAALRDFRLAALARGFSGWHVKCQGSENLTPMWLPDQQSALERRHPWSCDLKFLLDAEHLTAPRFAIYLPDLGTVQLGMSALPWSDYVRHFWAAIRAPAKNHCGSILVVTSSLNLQVLEDAGLLSWVLFDLETRLLGCEIASISLRRNADHRLTLAAPAAGPDPHAVLAAMAMTSVGDRMSGEADRFIVSSEAGQPGLRAANRQMHLSQVTPFVDPPGDMVGQLVKTCEELRRSPFAPDSAAAPPPATADGLNLLLRGRFGGAVLPPALHRPGPELAFVLPILEAGLIEQAAVLIAAALRRRGYVVSLVLLGATTLRLSPASEAAFDRVFFLTSTQAPEALNLLSVFDVVLACNATSVMNLMHRLQHRGVLTGAYIRRFEVSETGRHIGDAPLALAFEPALDMVVAGSDECALQLYERGVAAARLVTVPDAACDLLAPAAARASLEQHLARGSGRKLNVLCADWDGLGNSKVAAIRVAATAALAEHFEWADILLAPIDPGGLNLAILAAMQAGIVPIVSRVEMIIHGQTGYIVTSDDFGAQALTHILALSADHQLLRTLMAQAAAAAARDWDDVVGELDDMLRRRLAGRKRGPTPLL
jgi:glycosyltransferase involved in cell wall biosynthesis